MCATWLGVIFRKSPRKIARKHGLDLCKYEVRRPKIKDVFGAGFRKTIVFWMAGKKGFEMLPSKDREVRPKGITEPCYQVKQRLAQSFLLWPAGTFQP